MKKTEPQVPFVPYWPEDVYKRQPLPDTITISGLTLDIDGIALVFRFVPSVSGEGYELSLIHIYATGCG